METLLVQVSPRKGGSASRRLAQRLASRLGGATRVRDVSDGVPFVDETWTAAAFIQPEQRSADQQAALSTSDELVSELLSADALVIGTPMYNFGAPAALKAWMDQIARAGVTFAYTDDGPKGLVDGKRAWIVIASGGTAVGSEIDHLTEHLRLFLGFLGITDVSVVAADRLLFDPEAEGRAEAEIDALEI
jgi:FMN-dependent NADH-azoreductase